MPTKTVSVRVDEVLWQKTKLYCVANNLTLSGLVEALLEKEVRLFVETVPTECAYCKSKNFHPVEIDIGEYRQWRCYDCNGLFWGRNPSYKVVC